MSRIVIILFIQFGAAATGACFTDGTRGGAIMGSMCAVSVVGLLIDYARTKEKQ